MMNRVLVAVNDSAAALQAAALGIELAQTQGAALNLVTVAEPGVDADAILAHVVAMADRAGITAGRRTLQGSHAFEALLTEARRWKADLIIMGRSDSRRPGRPHVGSQTEHLLEFTEIPVLVVPEPTPRTTR